MRHKILQIIEEITPLDEMERSHQTFVKEWVATGARLFRERKPQTPKIHLVSYFVPFDEKEEKFLLVDHKKAHLWLPPGGHVDPQEHPKETARREMEEELFTPAEFYQEDPLLLTVSETEDNIDSHIDVSLWYVVKGDSSKEYRYDTREFHKIRWFSRCDVPEEREPHLDRFFDKLLK